MHLPWKNELNISKCSTSVIYNSNRLQLEPIFPKITTRHLRRFQWALPLCEDESTYDKETNGLSVTGRLQTKFVYWMERDMCGA